jgi:phenylalanyl-tRNA synthetase alpha chain
MNLKKINDIKQELIAKLAPIKKEQELEEFRLAYLTRQGVIAQMFETLKNLNAEDKREVGPHLNDLKKEIQHLFDTKKETLFVAKIATQNNAQQHFDVTLTKPALTGSLHPYTYVTKEIEDIFTTMGYMVVDGPELETDFFNFTGLNIPTNHPAREESDTFWIDETHLLRTQTSTVQLKTMMSQKPPIAMIAHGRTMRNEATDASHDFMFMQIEGMFIAKDVSVANLIATLKTFLTQFFGQDIKLRVRPGYFPFVEPGLEIDASCPFCKTGCSTCKKTGWIELLGAGLIHPNVLRHGGIDPQEFSGFAFGCGLTRLVMLKYAIPDIRLLHSGNLKFLEQF